MSQTPRFEFHVDDDADLGSRLLVGTASPGMPSLIAVDHLVSDLEARQVGHATAENLPVITPFTDGKPRHSIRLYETASGPALLVSEMFQPVGIGERFADAVDALATDRGMEDLTTLYSVPYPHGPDDHAVFSVATEAYPADQFSDAGVKPLSGGFLDGYAGRLLERGLSADAAVGALVTPAHPPGPDFESAILLVDVVTSVFDVDVETTKLEERSEEVQQYYQELASRMEAADEQDLPEDRMYM